MIIIREYFCDKCNLTFNLEQEKKSGYILTCPKCKKLRLQLFSNYKKIQKEITNER